MSGGGGLGEREKAKNQPSSFKMRIEATHTSLDLAGLPRVSVKTAPVSEFKPPLFRRRDSPFCGAGGPNHFSVSS